MMETSEKYQHGPNDFRFISPKSPLIILICGQKCVGKSTAANFIHETLRSAGIRSEILSLGTGVKDVFLELAKLFNLTTEVCYDVEVPQRGSDNQYSATTCSVYAGNRVPITYEHLNDRKTKEKLRPYLQAIGSDIMRNMVHPDIWTERTHNIIQKKCSEMDRREFTAFIIDDIRYQNELEFFKRHYCYTVSLLLKKPDTPTENADGSYIERFNMEKDVHESENQEITANFMYEVDKPMEEYRKDMREFVKRFASDMSYCKYARYKNIDWKNVDDSVIESLTAEQETWTKHE